MNINTRDDIRGPHQLLLNWNNQSAPGFMHGDDSPFGSVHRVELFDQWPRKPQLADVVSVMNRAATEDARSLAWPVVSRVLRSGPAPNAHRHQHRRLAHPAGPRAPAGWHTPAGRRPGAPGGTCPTGISLRGRLR